ncbi:unnamed protein product [Cochlearia groenlandica]
MEIEGEDGTKLSLRPGDNSVFGRGSGFSTQDLTVSRRHVSLQFKPSSAAAITGTELSDKVSFKVIGRNPIWTQSSGEKIQTFRRSETGEISEGNRFCVSSRIPVWFNLKKRDGDTAEKASDSESGLDYSEIDPVKEFGFLVIGIEFDQYPKSRVREVKQWEWFLEDSTNRNSDDDDDDGDKKGRKGLGGKRRRRKKGNEDDDDDDDWSVESEEDNALLVKSKRVSTPIYSTRSKKTKKDTNASNSSSRVQTKQRGRVDVDEEDDDDDETLGGFIVSDEEDKLEEEEDDDEEEEEEVDVDDDEDED